MKNRKAQGFTLIELLIVIAIIGILAAVLIPNLLSARQKANLTAGQAFTRNIVSAMETLRGADGKFSGSILDCNTGTNGFSTMPAAATDCDIIYTTTNNDYAINVTLDTGSVGVGNDFYTYSSLSQSLKSATTALTAP